LTLEKGRGHSPGFSRFQRAGVKLRLAVQPLGCGNRIRHHGTDRFVTVKVFVYPIPLRPGHGQAALTRRLKLLQITMAVIDDELIAPELIQPTTRR